MLDKRHPLGAGKTCTFAIGIFWHDRCEGVMTFGNSISNLAHISVGCSNRELIELRKMWLSDVPERNAESRSLAIAATIIRKRYPHLKAIITYCDSAESAASYRAAGWIAQQSHTYVGEVKVNGKWLTVRNANRLGVTKQATEKKVESRRKYVLPLHASVAEKVKRSATSGETTAPARSGRSNLNGTSNRESLPETGNESIKVTEPRTQAKSPVSPSHFAAASSTP
jgi:hypothetical protein